MLHVGIVSTSVSMFFFVQWQKNLSYFIMFFILRYAFFCFDAEVFSPLSVWNICVQQLDTASGPGGWTHAEKSHLTGWQQYNFHSPTSLVLQFWLQNYDIAAPIKKKQTFWL